MICHVLVALAASSALAQADPVALAEQAAAAGDTAAARRHLAESIGADATFAPGARPPAASQAVLIVTILPGQRTYELQLISHGEPDGLTALLREAAAALVAAGRVDMGTDSLTLVVPQAVDYPTDLSGTAAALPPRAELALLRAALSSGPFVYDRQALTFAADERYRETVNLRPASAACEQLAAALDTASQAGGAADERVAAVQRKIWAGDADAWRKFCARSRALYRVKLGSAGAERQWEIPAGETRQIETSATQWRYDRLMWAAGGVILLIVGFVAALWKVS
jgi:hypothetical protein